MLMFWGIDLSLILGTRKVIVKALTSLSFEAFKDLEQKFTVLVERLADLVQLFFLQIGK